MSRTITWLHLSDLHAGKPGASWDAGRVIETLVSDLKKMERDHSLHPDFIFFTGDAAFGQIGSGAGQTLTEQFATAQQFFTSVRQAFTPEIPSANLFLVPGNHDLDRTAVTEDQTDWLDKQKDRSIINKIIEAGRTQWQRYMERLAAYREFLKTNDYSHLLDDPERLVYAAVRQAAGVTVGIGGFNTAWSCCRDGEKSKLWMGSQWQLEQVHSKLGQAAVSIVLMHHPSNWLSEYEDPDFGHDLERDFKFILHGHEHAEWVTTGSDGYTRIAAGACYERPDKENGYNFVRLDLETGQGQVWLRKYDPKGGGWVLCPVRGKAEHGIWALSHLSWLTSIASSSPVPVDSQPPSTPIPAVAPMSVGPPRSVELSDILTPQGLSGEFGIWRTGFESKSLLLIVRQTPAAPEPPREDIAWQIIRSTVDYVVPIEEKKPLLQELRTEEQVARHFLPLPKFTDHLDNWLAADRDLLFLGLPFCGKTTLLTYVAQEASRRRRDVLIPIYLRPRENLTIEETSAAVVHLKDSLKQSEVLHQKQQVVLILDNVHTPVGLEIARLLIESPRPWRLWAAARFREFDDSLSSAGLENPWSEADSIRDACDLIGEKEMDFVVDQVIAPILARRGEERLVEQVRQTMKEAGQVPVRFLAQVWQLILENRGDVQTGYRDMIRAQPTGVEEIIRHVMPQHRVGIDALTIADYLKEPSWELLAHILSVVEEYGTQVAETTVASLRKTFALLPDSEQPCRATMYDPVRDRVKAPGNLTGSLKQQIWSGLESFLEQGDSLKEVGKPDDLANAWISLSDLAMNEERYPMALNCAQRANAYATDEHRIETLRQIAYCLHTKPQPEWDEAITFYRQALDLLTAPEQAVDRANTLWWIAYCLHTKPQPEWDEAITFYRQALDLLTAPEQAVARANILSLLANCLTEKPQPEWDEAITFYRQALDLLTAPEQAVDRTNTLSLLANCLTEKPQPKWDEAITFYRQALDLLTAPEQADDRANTLYQIAYCLTEKAQPEWDEAITFYRQALDLQIAPGQTIAQTAASHPPFTIGLIVALDGKGLYEEADTWASRLEKSSFIEGDATPSDEPLIARRRAYLALRSGDLETALSLARSLQDTSEHTRAMLLASIAYFAGSRRDEARQAIATAHSTPADVAWVRALATGFFNRHAAGKREEYLSLLAL